MSNNEASGGVMVTMAGDLSKPAQVLVEKISGAIGCIFQPWQIKRVAKAKADASRILVKSNVDNKILEWRTLNRFLGEEAKKQTNIENITSKSLPMLVKDSKPEEIEEDWITNFFDKCRLISDDEMQKLWAKILASEANNPGSFSKRTVNFMMSLDKKEAITFTKLCNYNWKIGDTVPLVFDYSSEIYKKNGVNFSTLKQLDAIGLISFEALTGYEKTELPQRLVCFYGKNSVSVEFSKEKDNQLKIGKVIFTDVGNELIRICDPVHIDGFFEYVLQKWSQEGIKIIDKT